MTVLEPVIRHIVREENGISLTLFVQPELSYFEGHFTNHPVLPGVVQTDWAIRYAAQYLDLPCSIKKLEVIKFKSLITPDTELNLTLQLKANGKLVFQYLLDGEVMSSGRIVYPGSQ